MNFLLLPPQNGLMAAVDQGYVDIVALLNQCPSLDINHQDNDGNTALMIAAQAGMFEDISPAILMKHFLLNVAF